MPDQKLTALTALATLSADDLFYVVDDPAGAATSHKLAASVLDARFATAAQGALAATALQPADIGVIVQAWDDDLDTIAGLAKTDGNFIVGDGAAWTVESGATARASLGLGSLATLSSMTLADVAGYSTTTAHQTFALNAGTQLILEQADGDDAFILEESDKSILMPGHVGIGNAAFISTETILFLNETHTLSTNFTALGITALIEPTDNTYGITGVDVSMSDFNSTKTGAFLRGLGFTVSSTRDGAAAYGIYGAAQHISGDATIIAGGLFAVYGFDFSGAVVTDYVGIEILNSIFDGVPPTNNYGIKINDVSGAATKNRAIHTGAGHVVFNENSDDDTDFRVEGATDANNLVSDGSADTVQVGAATASDSAKFYVSGKISASGEVEINGALNHDGTELGVFATAPTTQKTVTGSRGGNAALASLLTQLATYGLIVDSSTA